MQAYISPVKQVTHATQIWSFSVTFYEPTRTHYFRTGTFGEKLFLCKPTGERELIASKFALPLPTAINHRRGDRRSYIEKWLERGYRTLGL